MTLRNMWGDRSWPRIIFDIIVGLMQFVCWWIADKIKKIFRPS